MILSTYNYQYNYLNNVLSANKTKQYHNIGISHRVRNLDTKFLSTAIYGSVWVSLADFFSQKRFPCIF